MGTPLIVFMTDAIDAIGTLIAALLERPGEFAGQRIEVAGDEPTQRETAEALGAAVAVARSGQPPSGEGGMRGLPCTSGIRIASSSRKHQHQSSPGWSERMMGWPLELACALAWRIGELSQQPT